MKSIWLFILMIGGVAQLRAQQLTQPLTPGKTPDNSLYQYFRVKPDDNLFKLAPVSPKTSQSTTITPIIKELMAPEMVYNMPIAKLQSDDKMPIVKLGDPNTHYTMLIMDYSKTDTSKRVVGRP